MQLATDDYRLFFMYRTQLSRTWLLITGLFISLTVQAQKIEIGGSLGGMLCKGDVTPSLNPRFYSPAAGVFFRYNATRSFSMRAGFAIGGVRGEDRVSSDPLQQARDFSYRTNLNEITADFEYNFLNYKPQPKAKNWTPYVFGGVGIVNFKNAVVRARGMLAFPLGVGIKYEIKRPWSVGLEFGTRFSSNDYLDGLGDRTFGPNGTTNKLAQGNTALRDSYTYTAITVSYTFYKIFCP